MSCNSAETATAAATSQQQLQQQEQQQQQQQSNSCKKDDAFWFWCLQTSMNEMQNHAAALEETRNINESVDVFMQNLVTELGLKVFGLHCDVKMKLVGCPDENTHCFQPDKYTYLIIFESLDFLETIAGSGGKSRDLGVKPSDQSIRSSRCMSSMVQEHNGEKMLTSNKLKAKVRVPCFSVVACLL